MFCKKTKFRDAATVCLVSNIKQCIREVTGQLCCFRFLAITPTDKEEQC